METYDVIVCGGGTAGISAAIASARVGARTLVVERDGFLGGTATYGYPFLGFFSGDGTKVVGGVPQQLVDRMVDLGGSVGHVRGGTWKKGDGTADYEFSLTPYDPECLKFAAQEMILESGGELMVQSVLCDVQRDGPAITSIDVMTPEGKKTVAAKIWVDTTGDALLTWLAGFPTEMGGRGHMQNVSHVMRVGNVDVDRMVQALEEEGVIKGLRDWHIRLVEGPLLEGNTGFVHLAGHALLWEDRPPLTFTGVRWRKEEISFNITRTTNINPTNAADITRAEISERKNVMAVMNGMRERIPGFEKAYLVSSSVRVGIREGRRIRGLYTLTEDEVIERSEFPDGIARGAYPIDIHDPKGGKTQFTFIKEGGSYAVPYRCLIPQHSENLLVAGRCVSTTGKALGSVRLMACCLALGQAAGTAAAMASRASNRPFDLPPDQLRMQLGKDGAILGIS
jgi:hypothetical protein